MAAAPLAWAVIDAPFGLDPSTRPGARQGGGPGPSPRPPHPPPPATYRLAIGSHVHPEAHAGTDLRVCRDPSPGETGRGGNAARGQDGLILAVDIGGTKLAAGLVDAAGRVRVAACAATCVTQRDDPDSTAGPRAASRREDPGEALLGRLVALIRSVIGRVADLRSGPGPEAGDDPSRLTGVPGGPVVAVGVGCGGPMTAGGEQVTPLNITQWESFPLRRRLREELGLPVWVDNDAKALALAEGWVGAARDVDNYLAMVVSTGVGGGLVIDGNLLDGTSGNAGHIGHLNVVPDGRRCGCGARGCLEAEASGTAIAAITGFPPAHAGPELIARTGRLVGRAVAGVANLCDLRLAVVAGSVALGFGASFFAAAQQEVDDQARLAFSVGTRIVPAGLGADGPLVGAAAVGWRGWLGRLPDPVGPGGPGGRQ
ncbi:MAG: ROK family protein [Acidimicrobiales bacterium]